MKPEIIHDALNLLPSDLIQQTDHLRSHPRRAKARWTQFAALAASFVLVVSSVMLLQFRMQKSAAPEAAPEEPMMQAAPAVPAAPAADAAPVEEVAAEEAAMEKYQDTNTTATGHSHTFAEPEETSGTAAHAYCGNTTVTLHTDSGEYTLSGGDGIAIVDILLHLDYDPADVCGCAASLTVDTETLTGIEVSLEQSFARCERGQASLTEEQVDTIQTILDGQS